MITKWAEGFENERFAGLKHSSLNDYYRLDIWCSNYCWKFLHVNGKMINIIEGVSGKKH